MKIARVLTRTVSWSDEIWSSVDFSPKKMVPGVRECVFQSFLGPEDVPNVQIVLVLNIRRLPQTFRGLTSLIFYFESKRTLLVINSSRYSREFFCFVLTHFVLYQQFQTNPAQNTQRNRKLSPLLRSSVFPTTWSSPKVSQSIGQLGNFPTGVDKAKYRKTHCCELINSFN